MNGELLVTPQELKNTASSFANTNNKVKSITEQMMQKVRSLRSSFEGDAANAYIRKFEALQEDMNQIYNKIKEHVEDLNEMATNYERAESSNVQSNQSLKTDYI